MISVAVEPAGSSRPWSESTERTITDTVELRGKVIWIKNNGPVRPATFELTVE